MIQDQPQFEETRQMMIRRGKKPAIWRFIAFALVAFPLAYYLYVDSFWGRRAAAEKARGLSNLIIDNNRGPDALRRLTQMVNSWHEFTACYAMGEVGRLGELGADAVSTLEQQLQAGSGVRRSAAAAALRDIGKPAVGSADSLLQLIANHTDTSASYWAAEFIGKYCPCDRPAQNVLQGAINDSINPSAYEKALQEFTARCK